MASDLQNGNALLPCTSSQNQNVSMYTHIPVFSFRTVLGLGVPRILFLQQ